MRRAGVLMVLCACGGGAELPDAGDAAADVHDASTVDVVKDVYVDVGIDNWVAPEKPWERMPVVDYLGGALLTSVKVITVTFASDDATLVSHVQNFGDTITQTAWWTAATAEYCVLPSGPCIGPGSSGGHVVLNETAPALLTDGADETKSTVHKFIQDRITNGVLPLPDSQTIYQIWFPAGSEIDYYGGKSCNSFGAYHGSGSWILPDGGTVEGAYAIEPRCSDENYMTLAASHELIEAATDAHPLKLRAYVMEDISWNRLGDEVGDLCDHPWLFDNMNVNGFNVQRGWSNASARAGHDPCVIPPAVPYFNAAPESGKQEIYLGVGESATFLVQPFADQATTAWTLSAIDLGPQFGAGATLSFAFDKTTVNDGDVVHLTVKLTAKPTANWVPYVIDSKGNGQEHQWGASVMLK